jgi:large subunit ribosomal protein L2
MCYLLGSEGLEVGDKILTKNNNFLNIGNTLYLSQIPIGTHIHCLEFFKNFGAQISRAAGSYSTIISKTKKNCIVKLKSRQLKLLPSYSLATIGNVSNFKFVYKNFKKAGYYRRKG